MFIIVWSDSLMTIYLPLTSFLWLICIYRQYSRDVDHYISTNNVTKSGNAPILSRSNSQEYTVFFFCLHTLLMSNHIRNIYWIAFWIYNTLIRYLGKILVYGKMCMDLFLWRNTAVRYSVYSFEGWYAKKS